ncbi:MAG: T9SS type A sorting domain-containing protein, partial [Bacteroidetes bacterium]|nr:T9SS type A sorting domain-containing protein [Bacteroidota bacterium]
TTWDYSSAIIDAPAGLHQISLKAIGNNGLANIDYLNAVSLESLEGAKGEECDSLALSVEEKMEDSQLMIYPVPAGQYLNIEFSAPNHMIEQIVIYDLTGKKILAETGTKNPKMRVYLPQLGKGVYLIHVHSRNGVFVEKFQVVE